MKKTITANQLYIINAQTGRIDLKRTGKDYLDLKAQLQNCVNQSKDSFTVSIERHVYPTVDNAFNRLKKSKKEYPEMDAHLDEVELPNGEVLFFSFGLPAHMQGFTIKD